MKLASVFIFGVNGDELYSIDEQCIRIKAVREAAEQASIPIFINLEEAIRRACAYAESGASGFFAPGLVKFLWPSSFDPSKA
jgi:2-methylisocitrate lyase-like PEP mutase family enzyme